MKKATAIGGHQSAKMRTDEYLTDPKIVTALGPFDLDPCSPIKRPWDTAKHHYTILDDGLRKDWFGRVWMNPPYGSECSRWMRKLSGYGNGIALIFARTETEMFFEYGWRKADSIFFFEGRLFFYNTLGKVARANAGAPSCLLSYGEVNAQAIEESGLKGRHLPLTYTPMIIVGISPSWKDVIKIAITRSNGEAAVQEIYNLVKEIAPDKVSNNPSWKEKIRQKLQLNFNRKERGTYTLFN